MPPSKKKPAPRPASAKPAPQDPDLDLIASLAATFVAQRGCQAMAQKPALLRLATLFIAAFATYEAGLLLGAAVLPDNGAFAADIVAYVAFVDATWAIGLGAAYVGLQMLAGVTAVARQRRQA